MEEKNVIISKKKLYIIAGVILFIFLMMIIFLIKASNRSENKRENRQDKKEMRQGKRENKKTEKTEKTEKMENKEISQDSMKNEEIINDNVDPKKVSTENATDEFADWQTYTSDKYKYSFKYPKDLYVYEGKNYPNQNERCNLYTEMESPWDKLNEFGEYDVILSKTKLDDCSIGSLEDGSFGGDFLISTKGWMGGSINEDIEEIEKNGGVGEYGDEIFMFGEVKSKMTKSKNLDDDEPKEISFWAVTDSFNYFVMITQKDNKKIWIQS